MYSLVITKGEPERMVTVGICDDDPLYIAELAELITETEYSDNIKIKKYFSANDLLKDAGTETELDILFMDIQLGDVNGIDIAREVKKLNKFVVLIYVTAFDEYVYKVFETEPIGFLVKPAKLKDVESHLKRAFDKIDKREVINLQSHKKVYKIELRDIMYFKSEGRKICAVTRKGECIECYDKLDMFEDQLKKYDQFIRTHKSYIVNFEYVDIYEGDRVTMSNKEVIEISRPYRNEIRNRYMKLML